jgi:hypothetical protein
VAFSRASEDSRRSTTEGRHTSTHSASVQDLGSGEGRLG